MPLSHLWIYLFLISNFKPRTLATTSYPSSFFIYLLFLDPCDTLILTMTFLFISQLHPVFTSIPIQLWFHGLSFQPLSCWCLSILSSSSSCRPQPWVTYVSGLELQVWELSAKSRTKSPMLPSHLLYTSQLPFRAYCKHNSMWKFFSDSLSPY